MNYEKTIQLLKKEMVIAMGCTEPAAAALAGCDLADVNMIVLTIDPCISCTER